MGVVNMAVPLTHALKRRHFWRRVVLQIQNRHYHERYHCTYVVRVPWDPEVAPRFRTLRTRIEYIDRLVQEWKHVLPPCLGDHGEHIGCCTPQEGGGVVLTKLANTCPCILRAPWSICEDDLDIVTATVTDPVHVRAIRTWFDLRDKLQRALITHPCLTVVTDARWGHVQDVTIERDFLEKDQIRWWSVTDLTAVIAERGQMGPERFRPYFLPVLQTVLTQLGHPPLPPPAPVPPDPTTQEALCESTDETEPPRTNASNGCA